MVSLESRLTCLLLPWPPGLPAFSVAASSSAPWPHLPLLVLLFSHRLPHSCDLGKDVRKEDHLQVSNSILGQKRMVIVSAWSWQCHNMSSWCKSLSHPQSSYPEVLSWILLPLKGQLPTTGLRGGPVRRENVWLDSPAPDWDMACYLFPEAEVLWLVGQGNQCWQVFLMSVGVKHLWWGGGTLPQGI